MHKLQERFGHPKKYHLNLDDTVRLEVGIYNNEYVVKGFDKRIKLSSVPKYIRKAFQCPGIMSGAVNRILFNVSVIGLDNKSYYSALKIEWTGFSKNSVMNNILNVTPRYTNTEILEAIFDCFGIDEGEFLSKGIYLADETKTFQISSLETENSGIVHGGAWRVLSEGFSMIFRSLIPHDEYMRKYYRKKEIAKTNEGNK
nr:MAG TPA: hypothetical protein [Caudoviricetes sp.]